MRFASDPKTADHEIAKRIVDMIGWTERNRVWNPTAGDEYKLRQGQPNTPPASTENVNEYFRKRRPPAGEADSAYDATQN